MPILHLEGTVFVGAQDLTRQPTVTVDCFPPIDDVWTKLFVRDFQKTNVHKLRIKKLHSHSVRSFTQGFILLHHFFRKSHGLGKGDLSVF